MIIQWSVENLNEIHLHVHACIKSVILLEGHVLHVAIVYVCKCKLMFPVFWKSWKFPITVYMHSLRHTAANSVETQKYMIVRSHGVRSGWWMHVLCILIKIQPMLKFTIASGLEQCAAADSCYWLDILTGQSAFAWTLGNIDWKLSGVRTLSLALRGYFAHQAGTFAQRALLN